MKTLILLSKHFTINALEKLKSATQKDPANIKLAFCASPADKSANKDYVQESKREFLQAKIHAQEYSLDQFKGQPNRYKTFLKNFDANFFSGGNVIYFNHIFNEYNLRSTYRELVQTGLIHIGASAGALICSKNMKYYRTIDPIEGIPEYNDSQGLNLFNFYISPHYESKPKYTKAYETIIKTFPSTTDHIIPLTNAQAIFVQAEYWEII